MKKLIIISIAIISLLMAGCKKDESKTTPGSIYGTVTDKATGDCVPTAGVELMPKGLKTVTGSDGTFQFTEIDPGEYNLFITKTGYKDLKSNTITVKPGETAKGDVQIEKLPASLQIMDNDGQIISELNFGGDPGIVSKTFKIYNKGTESFRFEIDKYVDWIERITPSSSTVPVNGNCPIVVKIDRSKLDDGLNTTSIIITSPTVGGVELLVKARNGASGDVFILESAQLMVQLEDLGCVNWNSAEALCNNSTVANYNDWRLPTKEELMTLYNNRELIGGFTTECYWSSSKPGGYPYYVNFSNGNMTWEPSYNSTVYYVRAVRTYIPENDVFELTSANLMVQTQDLGSGYWGAADMMCTSSDLAGYTDWRLPNKEELMTLYNNRDAIGGFTNVYYWSSSTSSYGHYLISFADGYINNNYSFTGYANIRAVRTLNDNTTTPTISTSTPSNVTTNSVTCGGNVTSDGGATVTARGVCWSTSSNPSVNGNHLQASTGGTGSFTCNITGLSENTTYYVKAYATNSQGTAYGDPVPFTTTGGGSSATTPTVITTQPSNPTNNSVTCGGNVTSDGGATITERGVCWSTSSNPSIYGDHLPASTNGTGSFTCNITGLAENTTYYVKAYATNSEGTSYGSLKSFTTTGGSASGDEFLETFENGIPSNWAAIDADGDGYTFELGTEPEYSGHDGGNCAISASYINDIGALTPDNYLVTPQMQIVNGSKLRFYACAQDGDYPYEHFGVAVSLTSQSNASSFTTVAEWDMQAKRINNRKKRGLNEQGTWYICTVDLSSYAGSSVYIAIRHFNCTDQFYLDIDDVELYISK